MEVTTSNEVATIVRLVDEGIEGGRPSSTGGVFCAGLAETHIDWPKESHGCSYVVLWWTNREFIVNRGARDEVLFESPKLADLLVRLGQSQSLRVWWWSHPELQKPVMYRE